MKKKLLLTLFSLSVLATVAVPTHAETEYFGKDDNVTANANWDGDGVSAGTYSVYKADRLTVAIKPYGEKKKYKERENTRNCSMHYKTNADDCYTEHQIIDDTQGTYYHRLDL